MDETRSAPFAGGSAPGSDAARFRTTHWSVVLAARSAGGGPEKSGDVVSPPQAEQALAELCGCYWYPIYAFLRRQGHSPHEADDLTQGFFAELIERDYLNSVEPERGRFRWFLMHAVKRFRAKQFAKNHALKRGGAVSIQSLDANPESRFVREPATSDDPQSQFMRGWALTVLRRAVDDVREELRRTEPVGRFEALQRLVSGDDLTHADVANQLGMSSGAVKVAAHRLRKRFREKLRGRVAQTLDRPTQAEIDQEIDELFGFLEAR